MLHQFDFNSAILHSVAGGTSAIDIARLDIRTLAEADAFIACYGFDLKDSKNEETLWYFHRRALVLLTERLGFPESEIPEEVKDRRAMGDIRKLLLWASSKSPDDRQRQRWSCALLRCMHVYVHAENDLFSFFSEDIQAQILTPLQEAIIHDGTNHKIYLRRTVDGREPVELVGFHYKALKTSASTVVKLLAKPDALAMKVFDKLGVRFVTKNFFDSFRVVRGLIEENLISFPHIMPDQSSNNLYPVDLFLKICEELQQSTKDFTDDEIREIFEKRLEEAGESARFFRKANAQSDPNFRFIKFITRKLVEVQIPGKEPFRFFYPFEVQILDEKSHEIVKSGPSDHEAYKERQKEAARARLFPDLKAEIHQP